MDMPLSLKDSGPAAGGSRSFKFGSSKRSISPLFASPMGSLSPQPTGSTIIGNIPTAIGRGGKGDIIMARRSAGHAMKGSTTPLSADSAAIHPPPLVSQQSISEGSSSSLGSLSSPIAVAERRSMFGGFGSMLSKKRSAPAPYIVESQSEYSGTLSS